MPLPYKTNDPDTNHNEFRWGERGAFCRHSIKLEISWPSFFKFQSMFICCNRRQERVIMPRGGIVRQRDIGP